jgi:hypothetical protein
MEALPRRVEGDAASWHGKCVAIRDWRLLICGW